MITIIDDLENINIHDKLSLALGTFDGVHRGHQKIIQKAVESAKANNLKSAVVTFDKHPCCTLFPDKKLDLISNNMAKSKIIESMNVDYLIFLKFNKRIADMDPEKFLHLLKDNLHTVSISCGEDYTFGKSGYGNVELIKQYSSILNYKTNIVDILKLNGKKISSSLIREYMINGDIEGVNALLGYKYFFIGKIIHGNRIGNKLGFPTANIAIDDGICIRNGVYMTLCNINGRYYRSISNVGYAPTIEKSKGRTIETYIFDYDKSIYDMDVKVEFIKFIRDEIKFSSEDALKDEVLYDIDKTKKYFNDNVYTN